MRALTLLVIIAAGACQQSPPPPPKASAPAPSEPVDVAAPPATTAAPPAMPTRMPRHGRLVAVGDVHGDLGALRRTLRAAHLIDADDQWVGADATLVQTGDLLDRGDDEQDIIDLLERLRKQAKAKGGRVIVLNGNHEIMNVAGDLRYVTAAGLKDFDDVPGLKTDGLAAAPERVRTRLAAFRPGGPYARILASHRVVAIVGDSAFVHGGLLPAHIDYGLERLNAETRAWMLGQREMPALLQGQDSPVWTRAYSDPGKAPDCAMLRRTLDKLGLRRMIIGHTPQLQGPTQACEGSVWRIDVGMAAHYGGRPAAIEIGPEEVKVVVAAIKP